MNISEEYRSSMENVIYLARCAVNGLTPDAERVAAMDLQRLYEAASRHMMASITAMALESAGVRDEAFVLAEARAIRRNVAFDAEYARIAPMLEEAGIWYMPLKGALLKNWYPRFGMREMADCDILCDPTRMKDVRSVMESLGYSIEGQSGRKEHHDHYIKPPMFVFEMHRYLFDYYERLPAWKYYEDVHSRLIPDGERQLRLRFTPEDFYIYMLAHEFKHFDTKGSGLRSNLDIYVYLKKFSDDLDWKYIAAELEKLKLTEFERQSRALAMALFGEGELSPDAEEILENHLISGTYGFEENRIDRAMTRMGGDTGRKLRYVLERLFVPQEKIRHFYPVFWKYKILLPFLPLYRMIRGAVLHWPRVSREVKALLMYRAKN